MIAFLVLLALVLVLGAVVVGVLLERRMRRVPTAPTGRVPCAVAGKDAASSGRSPGAERTISTGRTLHVV